MIAAKSRCRTSRLFHLSLSRSDRSFLFPAMSAAPPIFRGRALRPPHGWAHGVPRLDPDITVPAHPSIHGSADRKDRIQSFNVRSVRGRKLAQPGPAESSRRKMWCLVSLHFASDQPSRFAVFPHQLARHGRFHAKPRSTAYSGNGPDGLLNFARQRLRPEGRLA